MIFKVIYQHIIISLLNVVHYSTVVSNASQQRLRYRCNDLDNSLGDLTNDLQLGERFVH